MRFTYDGIWADAVALLRADRSALIALAGAFLLLPPLLTGHFAPFEAPRTETLEALIDAASAHMARYWPAFFASMLVELLGNLAILRIFLKRDGGTVGGAIAASLILLPTLFAARLLANFGITAGLTLLIAPGLYLWGRLALTAPAIVAEERRNPIAALQRSFELTRGAGWRVIGLVLIIYLAGLAVGAAASSVFGSLAIILAGQAIGLLFALIVTSVVTAAMGVVLLAVAAALYRRLTSPDQDRVSLSKGI